MHLSRSAACVALLCSSFAAARPADHDLDERESGCVALDDCGGNKLAASATTSLAPLPTILASVSALSGDSASATTDGSASATTDDSASATTDDSASTTAPATAKKTTAKATAKATPPAPAPNNPIKRGYVAFGDSYAAGLGAGRTDGDHCRRAQYAYPAQLASTAPQGIDFQNLPCSGAKIEDIPGQINQWTNPVNADIATLSIGGNDLGFFPLLDACVIKSKLDLSGDCNQQLTNADNKMKDQAFVNDLQAAFLQMITKSGRSDFKIYVTGYPQFFNADTTYCNLSYFSFWFPGHDDVYRPTGNSEYLTQNRRRVLNYLVIAFNDFLETQVRNFNQRFGSNRVFFVDPNPGYNGHRFCEEGIQDPDKNNLEAYTFVTNWPDNSLPGTDSANSAYESELAAIMAGNTTALPTPEAACAGAAGSSDWATLLLCSIATAAANTTGVTVPHNGIIYVPPNDPYNGTEIPREIIMADQQNLAAKNYTAVRIPWWVPTNWAKTFHPRTLGHEVYKDAIVAAFARR